MINNRCGGASVFVHEVEEIFSVAYEQFCMVNLTITKDADSLSGDPLWHIVVKK